MMMFQSQQQQQQRQYQHGNTSGTSVSEWIDDYMRLKTKLDEYNTELTKFSNKYGYHHNGNHVMQRGAESGMPSKKRVLWTKEERDLFVIGLAKYGRGRWKQISEHVLPSKTPSQIASHAQKYFIRQEEAAAQNKNKKRRRSSIHDHDIITTTTVNECHDQAMPPPLPPPPQHNCNNWDDVAAPQDQKESSSCDEAMVLAHLPHDWYQLFQDDITTQQEEEPDFITYLNNSTSHSSPALHAAEKKSSDEAVILPHIDDLPPLPQQLQQQQQMYGFGSFGITTQEEEPMFINYTNSLSHSPFHNIAFP